MTVLYVAADQRGAGKTAFCATLAAELDRQGKRVAVAKPLRPDTETDTDPDVELYRKLLGQTPIGEPIPAPDGALTTETLDQIRRRPKRPSKGMTCFCWKAHQTSRRKLPSSWWKPWTPAWS